MVVGSLFVTSVASASGKREWQRPLSQAEMEVVESSGQFAEAEDVSLTLTRLDGLTEPTGLILRYEGLDQERNPFQREVALKVEETLDVGCGSVEIRAVLLEDTRNAAFARSGHRLNVVLTDHTNRKCRGELQGAWMARVTEGFGFCGTMDSKMTLKGVPEVVLTLPTIE